MVAYKKYYENHYMEIDVSDKDYETINSLSIYTLKNTGQIDFGNRIHVIIDWNTPKQLLDLAIEVLENGIEI
jgi:hypothetical protein